MTAPFRETIAVQRRLPSPELHSRARLSLNANRRTYAEVGVDDPCVPRMHGRPGEGARSVVWRRNGTAREMTLKTLQNDSRSMRLLLLGLALGLPGCGQPHQLVGHPWCLNDGMCSGGQICVHEHAHDVDWDACFVPCTGSHCPAGMSRADCLDSPSGMACTRDDRRTPACFCG